MEEDSDPLHMYDLCRVNDPSFIKILEVIVSITRVCLSLHLCVVVVDVVVDAVVVAVVVYQGGHMQVKYTV